MFVFASVNVCRGGGVCVLGCVCECVCQSGKAIPPMGMTDAQGVAQLVLSATREAPGRGVCVGAASMLTSHPPDSSHFVLIHVLAAYQKGRLLMLSCSAHHNRKVTLL